MSDDGDGGAGGGERRGRCPSPSPPPAAGDDRDPAVEAERVGAQPILGLGADLGERHRTRPPAADR